MTPFQLLESAVPTSGEAKIQNVVSEKKIDLIKDGVAEAEAKAAKERQNVPLEIRVKQFKDMLKEKEVSAFSTWEKELHKIVFDPRYVIHSLASFIHLTHTSPSGTCFLPAKNVSRYSKSTSKTEPKMSDERNVTRCRKSEMTSSC